MEIKVADRIRPFSLEPGTFVPLPHSKWGLQIFPTHLRLIAIEGEESFDAPLNIKGPVQKFSIFLDVEKGCVQVLGHSVEGYFRYLVVGKDPDIVHIVPEKGLQSPLLQRQLPFMLETNAFEEPFLPLRERISFGVTKKQDWKSVLRRKNLAEILPIWFALGQRYKDVESLYEDKSLLGDLQHAILDHDKRQIVASFEGLIQTGFKGILYPRKEDEEFQGYELPPLAKSENALVLLSVGYKLIRSLFCLSEGSTLKILPCLLHPFHAGRATGLVTQLGTLDIEWTKDRLRRLVFKCSKSGSLNLAFPKNLRRVTVSFHKVPHVISLPLLSSLDLTAGSEYFFDHFEE